ncbi:hypothetical protein DFJ58DRAFT_855880 [Suillus subalutaceus]|uniref:uncharacterized protein n=1 Tax=Suillus subalutaceus TaxID=48586 RepID=UPI001B87D8D1|nr:uncharacterized protein DFJ58DRAFT_855880 [Suillus subalutaceus]KAG1869472.1 hypothetical protein DFJ58DRAFT_855880 [Suillus subalutaceus]
MSGSDMVSRKSTQRSSVRMQGLARIRPKVQLTKRPELPLHYDAVDDAAIKIATDHKKTVCRVQHELHMGRSLLQVKHSKISAWNSFLWKKRQDSDKENYGRGKDILGGIMKDFKDKYHSLTDEEKADLIEEYKEFKVTKTTGQRISTKLKLNDAANTLKVIKVSLRSRTGVETIMYMSRGTTDIPLRGTSFATEGVRDFMGSVVGIDNQDLVNKMEGFTIQGMKGAAHNHQKLVSHVRAQIRSEINQALREKTGVPDATMHWAQYWRNVVKRYSVIIEGWPKNIPFVNLSTASSALPDLEMLLRKWRSKAIKWKCLTEEELDTMEKERDDGIGNGAIKETHRRLRSDKGKKRRRNADDETSQHHRKKTYKSMETIDSDISDIEEDHQVDSPVQSANNLPAGSPFEDSENMPRTNHALTPSPILHCTSTPPPISDHTSTPPPISDHTSTPPPISDHASTPPPSSGNTPANQEPAPPIFPGSSANLSSLVPPFNNQIDNFIPTPFAHTEFNFDGIFSSY